MLWLTLDHGHTYIHVLVSELGNECVYVCMYVYRNVHILYIVCIAEANFGQVWFQVALHYYIFITSHSALYKY